MQLGDRVLRRGHDPTVGIVSVVSETHARVAWPMRYFRKGHGTRHSDIKLCDLVAATSKEVLRRKELQQTRIQARDVAKDHLRQWSCLNIAAHGFLWHLMQGQVHEGRCYDCQAPVVERESMF